MSCPGNKIIQMLWSIWCYASSLLKKDIKSDQHAVSDVLCDFALQTALKKNKENELWI